MSMNRKLLLGAAFFLAGANLVQASDLPPTYDSDWTGFYGTLFGRLFEHFTRWKTEQTMARH